MTTDGTLVERVRAALADTGGPPTPARVAQVLRQQGAVLGDATVLAVTEALRADIAGAGPLEPLLREPDVTDVLVNGVAGVFVDRGEGLVPVPLDLGDAAAVRRLAVRLAAAAGRRLDDAAPWVDARLPDGTRLHAVLPPVAPDGPCISLRRPARRPFTLDDLVATGSCDPDTAVELDALVRARRSFLVTGGTGAGKTTVLAALLSRCARQERLVLAEDTAELRPDHPHVVRLEGRPPNVEGAGRVELRDLVRQALRMRPDRLVVGEVRGPEVIELLGALNTGHDGGCGTLHASSPEGVPARLEALGVAAGLSRPAVHSQVAAGLDAVVHLGRSGAGQRRVEAVAVVVPGPDGLVEVVPAVRLDRAGRRVAGPAHQRLAALLSGDR